MPRKVFADGLTKSGILKSFLDSFSKLRIAHRLRNAKKLRPLTTIIVISTLLVSVGVLSGEASAFQVFDVPNPLDPDDPFSRPVHYWIADAALGDLIRPDILVGIKHQNAIQDYTYADGFPQNHFLQSLFAMSSSCINNEYREIIKVLSQETPCLWCAEDSFGMLIHTVQDFYAHSNWVEIWTLVGYYRGDHDFRTEDDRPPRYLLYEPGLRYWHVPTAWDVYLDCPFQADDPYYADIMIAQSASPDSIPEGYNATKFLAPAWELDPWVSYLPQTRVPTIVVNATNGTSKTFYALETTAGGCSYKPIELEHGWPDELGKDFDSREHYYYEDAYWNAVAQTRHEFWRALALTRGSDYSGSCALLGYWLRPDAVFTSGIPAAPVTATVSITSLTLTGWGSTRVGFSLVAAREKDGDFKDCVKGEADDINMGPDCWGRIDPVTFPASLTLSLDPTDTLVMGVEPWMDLSYGGGFNRGDLPLDGATLFLKGADLRSGTYNINSTNVNATLSVTISAPPGAEAGGPYSGVEGTAVTFNAAGSSDFDGRIVSYEWDLDGDGEYDEMSTVGPYLSKASTTASHTYVDDFTGTVGLRVTDNDGLSATDSATVTIQNVPPSVEAGPDIQTYPGQLVTVNATYTDPGVADTQTFTINWLGDEYIPSRMDGIGTGPASGGSVHTQYVYPQVGTYALSLTVTDDDGGSGTDTLTVNVMPRPEGPEGLQPPVASFTVSPSIVYFNTEVNFDASQSSDVDGEIVSYEWDLGDGNATSGLSVAHTYSVPGEYAVLLVVVDNDGLVSARARIIQVRGMQPPPAWVWVTTIIAVGGVVALALRMLRARRAVKP